MFLGFREGGSRAGPGPGSRGAVIKADSAVIFTAHCITALPCCIPHAAQLLEWSEKFGATAQLAEEERGHSPRSKKATLASAPRTDLLGALGQPVLASESAKCNVELGLVCCCVQLQCTYNSGLWWNISMCGCLLGVAEVCKVNCVQSLVHSLAVVYLANV